MFSLNNFEMEPVTLATMFSIAAGKMELRALCFLRKLSNAVIENLLGLYIPRSHPCHSPPSRHYYAGY